MYYKPYNYSDPYLLTEVVWDWVTDVSPPEPQAPPAPSREPAAPKLSMLALFTLSRELATSPC